MAGLTGCSLINDANSNGILSLNEREQLSVEAGQRFSACRSMNDVNDTLTQLVQSPNAQQQAESLIAGWGKHGDWHDVAVVEFLLKHWPSAYGRDPVLGPDWERYDCRRLFDVTQSAVMSQPELVYQVFWYYQWMQGPLDFPSLMHGLEVSWPGSVHLNGEEYPLLLLEAGIASDLPAEPFPGSLMSSVGFETLATDRLLINGYVASQRPFLRYDHDLGRYVVDKVAKSENRYLSPKDQTATPRTTPLPGWSSGPVPKVTD